MKIKLIHSSLFHKRFFLYCLCLVKVSEFNFVELKNYKVHILKKIWYKIKKYLFRENAYLKKHLLKSEQIDRITRKRKFYQNPIIERKEYIGWEIKIEYCRYIHEIRMLWNQHIIKDMNLWCQFEQVNRRY